MAKASLPSTRERLSRVLVLISLSWGLVLTLTVGVMLHRALDALLDQGLQESAEILYGLAQTAEHSTHPASGMLPAPPHEEDLLWQRIGANGLVQLRSHKAPLAPLTVRQTKGFADQNGWRTYTLPLPEDSGYLVVAQPQSERQATLWTTVLAVLGTALLLGVVSTYWLNRRLLRELSPLQDLSAAVGRYDPLGTTGHARLPEPTRAELQPLSEAITELGRRLATNVAQERAFAAHAAHALRTPLAGMDAQLAVALKEAPEALRPRLTQTREAGARLRTVVSALINLFRAGGEVHWQRLAVSELLARLPVRGVVVRAEGDAHLEADPDLLSAALMNLLDNAQRHQATDVTVLVQHGIQSTVLTLSDNGSGIESARMARLNQALLGQGPRDDMGLGLTLSQQVAKAHGGQLALHNASDGRGVCVTLTLAPSPV